MKTILDSCIPRVDVLTGELRDDMFAAKLRDVMDGTADPIYQKPDLFFENTYPTVGLKTLAAEMFGRLAERPGAAAVVRLETQFGGGKTHNLIALYHLAKAAMGKKAVAILDASLVPSAPVPFIAGIVGSEMETSGLDHGGVTTFTVWGEIAYQLGGREGYARVADSDQAGGPAPGCSIAAARHAERRQRHADRRRLDAPQRHDWCCFMLDGRARRRGRRIRRGPGACPPHSREAGREHDCGGETHPGCPPGSS